MTTDGYDFGVGPKELQAPGSGNNYTAHSSLWRSDMFRTDCMDMRTSTPDSISAFRKNSDVDHYYKDKDGNWRNNVISTEEIALRDADSVFKFELSPSVE